MLHVDIPTRDEIEELIRNRGPARVTLYQPTTPVTQHAQADLGTKRQVRTSSTTTRLPLLAR
jgi:hypothetical protein